MDVRFINPFIIAIQNVFATMLETDTLIGRPRLKTSNEIDADTTAIIGFSGEAKGSVALCFPQSTAVKVASKFAGIEMSRYHPDFADALGELANMVAGQAKARFEGVRASISLPRVITGKELQLLESNTTPILVMMCDSSLGRFSTEVTMIVSQRMTQNQKAAHRGAE